MRLFQSTLNTRSVLANSLKYIRSDVPIDVSEDETAFLLSNNITTVVDLRTEAERLKKQCPLMTDNRFSYYCFPVSGGDCVPCCVEDVAKSYIGMVDTQFEDIITFLLNAESNVLYFCNAGKDRTGVVSAALLYELGASHEYIIEDYMRSKNRLEIMLRDYAQRNPTVDINVITPCEQYIVEFLKWYGGRKK